MVVNLTLKVPGLHAIFQRTISAEMHKRPVANFCVQAGLSEDTFVNGTLYKRSDGKALRTGTLP